jgi:T4 RnlA family RNA ligase
MFEIDLVTKKPLRLACMMPEKFFNLGENPFTMNLTFNDDTVDEVMIKEDGSIISTYILGGQLALKSKTSISSLHCAEAMKWLKQEQNRELKDCLEVATQSGYSVHMEFVSPSWDLKVVVDYPKANLIIHSIRSIADGSYVEDPIQTFGAFIGGPLSEKWVTCLYPKMSMEEFVAQVPAMEGIEGVIIKMKTGQKIKYKTDWYNARHHAKFGIKSLRHLFEYLIDEKLDDVKAMLVGDEYMMGVIANVESTVIPLYNAMYREVEEFYQTNKDLDRKSYAIKGQQEFSKYFGLAMTTYLGKEPDFKGFAKKNPELFGIDPHQSIGSMYVDE